MRTSTLIICVMLLIPCAITAQVLARGKRVSVEQTTPTIISAQQFKTDIQALWENNVAMTRNVVICIVNFQPGIDVAVNNLIKDQNAIVNVVKHYYGNEAGEKLSKLFHKNNIVIADFMIARRNGRSDAYETADNKWRESTEDILALLGQVNPNCNGYDMRRKMYEQIEYTKEMITAVKNKDDSKERKAYNWAVKAGTDMAEIFSDGIIRQFPSQFIESKNALGIK